MSISNLSNHLRLDDRRPSTGRRGLDAVIALYLTPAAAEEHWCAESVSIILRSLRTNPLRLADQMSSSTMAQTPFSADVFYNILMFIGVKTRDLVFLWTTCREVSRDFKNAVEHVFITRHIKKTFLKIDGGTFRVDLCSRCSQH